MSIQFRSDGASLASYRSVTDKANMVGVRTLSFMCGDCHTPKSVTGRKSRGYKMGFRCASCAEKKGAK